MAAAEKKAGPFVRAALVAVKTSGGSIRQLRYGDVITEDVSKESVDLLKELDYLSDENPLNSDTK